jgi:hypothetical protein
MMKKSKLFLILITLGAMGLLASNATNQNETISPFYKLYKYRVVDDAPNDFCDPNNDPQCEIILDEENPCNTQYDQCLNQCKSEDCLEKCDVEYEACLDSL